MAGGSRENPVIRGCLVQDLEEVEVDFPELLEYCNRMNLPLLETSAKVGGACRAGGVGECLLVGVTNGCM